MILSFMILLLLFYFCVCFLLFFSFVFLFFKFVLCDFFFNSFFDVECFFKKSLLNLLQYCFCFMFWIFGLEACGILTP